MFWSLSKSQAACIAIFVSLAVVSGWTGLRSGVGVFAGLGLLFTLYRSIKQATSKSDPRNGADSTLYGLDHGRLNVTLPPPSMWMNMGFWKHTQDFPTACRHLLEELLIAANLLCSKDTTNPGCSHRTLTIIDLGFGCGDQTVYLTKRTSTPVSDTAHPSTEQQSPIAAQYLGLTLNQTQFQYARRRLGVSGISVTDPSIQIWCEDAAKPDTWPTELATAMKAARDSSLLSRQSRNEEKSEVDQAHHPENPKVWVLALDTLYHFSPSRLPILQYSYHKLSASLMAFDLIVADKVSIADRILLCVVSLLSGTPFHNFMTEAAYRSMLVSAGYKMERIEIRDISEHVFAPLSRFLEGRERDLKVIGLSIGSFRFARMMFAWWARSRVVKGVIVVARR